MSSAASVVRWGNYFQEDQKRILYTDEMRHAIDGITSTSTLEQTFHIAPAANRLDRTLYTDIHNYLPGALLTKMDRMSIAHSLEARSPFQDHEVMQLAARLPANWKVRGKTTKWALRKVFQDLMPDVLNKRSKFGFGVPVSRWFRGPLRAMAKDLLLGNGAATRPYTREQKQNTGESLSHAHGRPSW